VVLKNGIVLEKGEVVDATRMSVNELNAFF